jgi:hydroxymethylpyrimidine/phosphomethylpyrimidine kinase
MTKVALTIAGSDSGGGAGIQADLKTFAFHCVHGVNALTCITAQNTIAVAGVEAVESAMIVGQIEAILQDIKVDAVKTGMLLNPKIIEAVAQQLDKWHLTQLVVDPVMVSRRGAQLLDELAITSLKQLLIPKALIVTPNRYEAQLLSEMEIKSVEDMKQAASKIHQNLGAKVVLVKGGGMPGSLKGVDLWFDGNDYELLRGIVVDTNNTHGTGCTLSAAIAANLALGKDLYSAVQAAKDYVTNALQHSLSLGAGNGPVGHFFPLLS